MHQYSRFRAVATLFLLAFIWGTSFLLMKKALLAFNPFQVGAIRMVFAALSLLPFALPRIREVPRKAWWMIAVVGILGSGIPSILFPLAQRGINSATAGVLNGLTPAFTLIMGVLFFGRTTTWVKVVGLIVGFTGAAILAANGKSEISLLASLGFAGLAVLATVCYGVSVNMQKSLANVPPLLMCAFALAAAAIPDFIYLIGHELYSQPIMTLAATNEHFWWSLGQIAILAVFSSGISFVIFNDLVQKTDAVFASTSTYITPIFALLWGLIDHEVITPLQYVGMVIILLGVYILNTSTAKKEVVQG